MNTEQKQALIGLCKIEIKRWKAASESDPNMRYMVELMGVALAALTAEPVKAPEFAVHANQPCWPSIAVGMRDDEWKQALRAQGYQVEGE